MKPRARQKLPTEKVVGYDKRERKFVPSILDFVPDKRCAKCGIKLVVPTWKYCNSCQK
jgi:hypothetical protein